MWIFFQDKRKCLISRINFKNTLYNSLFQILVFNLHNRRKKACISMLFSYKYILIYICYDNNNNKNNKNNKIVKIILYMYV